MSDGLVGRLLGKGFTPFEPLWSFSRLVRLSVSASTDTQAIAKFSFRVFEKLL